MTGVTADGRPVDDEMIEWLREEAERGSGPEQQMRAGSAERAAEDGVSVSGVIRRALGEYLKTG